MAAHPGTEAALSGSQADIRDETATSWPRSPAAVPTGRSSSISPSVSAPGVDILAAAGTDNNVEWHFISGTSMASPHTAGALALLKGMQLDVPLPPVDPRRGAVRPDDDRGPTSPTPTAPTPTGSTWAPAASSCASRQGRPGARRGPRRLRRGRPRPGRRRPRPQHGQHGRRRVPADVRLDPYVHRHLDRCRHLGRLGGGPLRRPHARGRHRRASR